MIKKPGSMKVYLDFRSTAVRVVEGRFAVKPGIITVNKFGTVFFGAEDAFSQGSNRVDDNAVKLRDFLKTQNIKTKKAVLCLGHQGIVVRAFSVPKMSLKDLKSHMELEVNDYLPVDPEEYAFDYKILNTYSEDERDYLSLLAAAVLNKHVEESVSIVESAGLEPLAVDIFPSVIWDLLIDKFKDIAVVDSGREGSRLLLCRGEAVILYADIPFQFKDQGENDFPQLIQEIIGYLDFFASRNYGKSVDRIYITGELAADSNIPLILEGMLNIPVNPGLEDTGEFEIKSSVAGFKKVASVYAANIGLMLKEV